MEVTRILARNVTSPEQPPTWGSEGQWVLPSWGEPMIVFTILWTSMFLTRRRNFNIFGSNHAYRALPLNIADSDSDSARSSDELLYYDVDPESDAQDSMVSTKHLRKRRDLCCGLKVYTPNSSRFANHFHSRIMQKFPFLMEMFYWIVTYGFYRMTKITSQAVFDGEKIWDVAQRHAQGILWFEHESWFSWFFPVSELDVQHWFLNGHSDALTFLNRAYALIHIPGTVGFIAWYYYVAPNHSIFAIVRRTLTLTNFLAFTTFVFYPTMPPRLLPKEYGFLDTVRHDNAESVWMKGEVVNSLAAMPSMHFGYSFCIGCTILFHSGVFRRNLIKGEARKSVYWKIWYVLIGVGYPLMVLTAIVSTANHYYMDAIMATVVAAIGFFCNRIFLVLLPLEDYLLWCLRIEKPTPITGEVYK